MRRGCRKFGEIEFNRLSGVFFKLRELCFTFPKRDLWHRKGTLWMVRCFSFLGMDCINVLSVD
jgi:hypothetical protein